jgi:His-Xaa-Ser system protein HxsD
MDGPTSDGPGSVVIVFPLGLYSLDTIKKAAYRFANLAAVEIFPGDAEISCRFHFSAPLPDTEVQRLLNDFRIEVLDQDLRASIASETAPMRNAILAYAFSKTGIQGE